MHTLNGSAYVPDYFIRLAVESEEAAWREVKSVWGVGDKAEVGFEDWFVRECQKPRFVRAPSRLRRQAAQSGRYILFPNYVYVAGDEGPWFNGAIRPMSKDARPVLFRAVVPAACKREMLRSLRKLGVTRAALFPDSVDEVCADIVESCKPLASVPKESLRA